MFTGIAFVASPFPWVFLGAIAFAAALSRATMSTGRKAEPERARTWKWVFVCLYLSAAILLGLAAVLIPGPEKIRDVRLAYLAVGAAGVSFFALRFKKALGIPVILLAALLVMVTGLFLRSLQAFTGETEIATVRVIGATDSRMKLELIPEKGEAKMLDMEGGYFAPIVKVVIFDDSWVFLGAKTWYRFVGVTSFRAIREGDKTVFRQGNTDFYFGNPSGIAEAVYSFFENNEKGIPGVKSVQIEVDMKKARELASYSIRVQNDGGVEVVPLNL